MRGELGTIQPSLAVTRLGLHVGAKDRVDARLVPRAGAEPVEKIRVEAHGDDLFRLGKDDLGSSPEFRSCRQYVGVFGDGCLNLFVGKRTQPLPIGF